MMNGSFSVAPLPAGSNLDDRFELLGVLGEGMGGIVYDALRLPEKERVALKVLHAHLVHDRQLRGRFEREAKILGKLHGPHVCPVLEQGELGDPRSEGERLFYMALPRIEGPTLDARLHEEGLLPLDRSLDVLLQICDALKVAHEQGIVHRDLKPANVLLQGGTHVVVVDFGLAKILTGEAAATALTARNMVCGTPEYMAPEQARGDEIDARCDLYAAGVILYELLTGEPPFSGPTPLSVLTAHLTVDPVAPRLKAADRGISPALDAVTRHALAKGPDQRYPTAGSLAAAVLHARARPDDVEGVDPARFAPARESVVDVHGKTMPGEAHVTPASVKLAPAPPPALTTSPRPSTSLDREAAQRRASRVRVLVFLLAATLGIAFGVWLSLRLS